MKHHDLSCSRVDDFVNSTHNCSRSESLMPCDSRPIPCQIIGDAFIQEGVNYTSTHARYRNSSRHLHITGAIVRSLDARHTPSVALAWIRNNAPSADTRIDSNIFSTPFS